MPAKSVLDSIMDYWIYTVVVYSHRQLMKIYEVYKWLVENDDVTCPDCQIAVMNHYVIVE